MGSKRLRDRPRIWLMVIIVICLTPVMNPTVANIIMTALAV